MQHAAEIQDAAGTMAELRHEIETLRTEAAEARAARLESMVSLKLCVRLCMYTEFPKTNAVISTPI